MKVVIEALLVGVIALGIIFLLSGCSTKRKTIQVNCEDTAIQLPQGTAYLCERY